MKACQQDELYAAERTVDPGEVMSLPQAQAWIDDMLQQEWWGETFPMVRFVEVFKLPVSAPRSVGAYITEDALNCAHLEMLPQHLTPMILMHELAHACAAARYNSHAHDPWFARTYLDLVFRACGWGKWQELAAAFDEHGIDADVDTTTGNGIAL